jgi:hypothetical protein
MAGRRDPLEAKRSFEGNPAAGCLSVGLAVHKAVVKLFIDIVRYGTTTACLWAFKTATLWSLN